MTGMFFLEVLRKCASLQLKDTEGSNVAVRRSFECQDSLQNSSEFASVSIEKKGAMDQHGLTRD